MEGGKAIENNVRKQVKGRELRIKYRWTKNAVEGKEMGREYWRGCNEIGRCERLDHVH